MSLIFATKSRGVTKDITIQNGAGATITPADGDAIRIRIGYLGTLDTAPKLEVSSAAATANGSSFTKNSPTSGTNRLRLDGADLSFAAGTYTLAVDYYDSNDSAEWKTVSRQVFTLEDT